MQNETFLEVLWAKGRELYRPMPWRDHTRPYYVLVSEMMLQQTQVSRVIPKFERFVERFPDERHLAAASLAEVVTLWQGLGYNRRAKYLHEAAKTIVEDFDGTFPSDHADLLRLPGVGNNTAGAVAVYAFNLPRVFIETNIRTVYLHHFFSDDIDVSDHQIRRKLEETLDREHPREFYWAVMDYGTWLKANGVRNIAQSKHYKKQSALNGSVRQVRGRILKELSRNGSMSAEGLAAAVERDERYEKALQGLIADGLVSGEAGRYHLTK